MPDISAELKEALNYCGDEHRRNFEDGAKVWNNDQLRRYGAHVAMMLDAYEYQLGEMIKRLNEYEADRRRFFGVGKTDASILALRIPHQ